MKLFDATLDLARFAQGIETHKITGVDKPDNTFRCMASLSARMNEYTNGGTCWFLTGNSKGEFGTITAGSDQWIRLQDVFENGFEAGDSVALSWFRYFNTQNLINAINNVLYNYPIMDIYDIPLKEDAYHHFVYEYELPEEVSIDVRRVELETWRIPPFPHRYFDAHGYPTPFPPGWTRPYDPSYPYPYPDPPFPYPTQGNTTVPVPGDTTLPIPIHIPDDDDERPEPPHHDPRMIICHYWHLNGRTLVIDPRWQYKCHGRIRIHYVRDHGMILDPKTEDISEQVDKNYLRKMANLWLWAHEIQMKHKDNPIAVDMYNQAKMDEDTLNKKNIPRSRLMPKDMTYFW